MKIKKETLQMLSLYDRPMRVETSERTEVEQKSSEECSLLNARIRRKLNHRKIIALSRKT